MSNSSNLCVIDFSKQGMNCNENTTIKYSEDIKSINDVIPCNTTATNTTTNTTTNTSINNNVVNANWNCTDRGSCAMGKSYQK
jgi:hypothetical protein